MYDIKPLEEEWDKYTSRKRRPIYLILLLISVLLGGLYGFYNFYNFKLPSFNEINKVSKTPETRQETLVLLDDKIHGIQVEEIQKIEQLKPTVTIKPAIREEEVAPIMPIVENIPILEVVEPQKKKKRVQKQKVKRDKPRKKMHLNIIESSSVSAYKDVERRFYDSHDTDDSLFLAKSYFRKGNYKKAEYWALQTNKVNQNIDESWIIFAKSKVKLGRKNEAIQLLRKYVKQSNSTRARRLLYKLKN